MLKTLCIVQSENISMNWWMDQYLDQENSPQKNTLRINRFINDI